MDVDVDSVETELNAYTRVQLSLSLYQVTLDTGPLMWWKQHVQEFPHLTPMTTQYLSVSATSASPVRLFSIVGLVKSDFTLNRVTVRKPSRLTRCGLNKHPELHLKQSKWTDTNTHTPRHTHTYLHSSDHCVTDTRLSLSLTPTNL